MEDIGKFLKKLRGKMTFREAAEKSGLSHSYIRYLELGKRPGTNTPINPTPESLRGLAKAYGYSYTELMRLAGYNDEDEEVHKEESKLERDKKEIMNFIRNSNDPKEIELTLEVVKKMLGK